MARKDGFIADQRLHRRQALKTHHLRALPGRIAKAMLGSKGADTKTGHQIAPGRIFAKGDKVELVIDRADARGGKTGQAVEIACPFGTLDAKDDRCICIGGNVLRGTAGLVEQEIHRRFGPDHRIGGGAVGVAGGRQIEQAAKEHFRPRGIPFQRLCGIGLNQPQMQPGIGGQGLRQPRHATRPCRPDQQD